MNFQIILYIIGVLTLALSAGMIAPMMVDLHVGHSDWQVFFFCALTTAFFGGLLVLSNRHAQRRLTAKQGFLMISAVWIALSLFAALPLWLCELNLSFVDAVFESVSGLTTTGSTVIVGLDNAPPGILLWRAILQWMGGIGIILMAMTIMPFLKIGGMQLFMTEMTESDKTVPRIHQLSVYIGIIYLTFTIACIISYHLAGLDLFDSVAHAMTTISTGGYSTYDASFAAFDRPAPLIVSCVFMIIGGLPFILYLKAMRGNPQALFRDSQVRWFLSIVAIAIITLMAYLMMLGPVDMEDRLLHAAFNVISIVTGTGFASSDFGTWGAYSVGLFFFLMMMGACAGSTTCGIKVFRFQIIYAVAESHMRKLLYPNGVFAARYNGKPIPDGIPLAVMGFFFTYALSFVIVAIALSMTGLDFISAVSGSATSISNAGPGLGSIIGPAGNFSTLTDAAKWILSFAMILGRLELFPLLVWLSPYFWRK